MTAPVRSAVRARIEAQRDDELCAASARALSGDPSLSLPDRAGSRTGDDFRTRRGAADSLALRRLHSHRGLFRRTRPGDPHDLAAQQVFDLLEQYRCESLARLPGVRANLRHRHESWSTSCGASGRLETAAGVLLFTVAQVCRSRLTGEPVPESVEGLIEATRFELGPRIGGDLAALRRHRADQAAYAGPARVIAETIAGLLTSYDDSEGIAHDDAPNPLAELLDPGEHHGDDEPRAQTRSTSRAGQGQPYTVFTRAHDREHAIADLVRPARREELRERLDECVREQRVNVPRLARALEDRLARPVRGGWDDGQEQGLVDGRRLTQLIGSPTERRLFRTETDEPETDCLVTFLLDCSGSMRRHRETVAVIVDVLSRALDLAGVSTEVLGFSTGSWNGGASMRDWSRSGRPSHPGRIADLAHLVVKDADTSWRRARRDLAGLLKEDLYREGVDGEAVAWACRRMHARTEERRLLVVVSDGGPSESATALTNGEHYLDRHLREVVRLQDAAGTAHIRGIGLGPDLATYYPHALAIDPDERLGTAGFGEIVELIAEGMR